MTSAQRTALHPGAETGCERGFGLRRYCRLGKCVASDFFYTHLRVFRHDLLVILLKNGVIRIRIVDQRQNGGAAIDLRLVEIRAVFPQHRDDIAYVARPDCPLLAVRSRSASILVIGMRSRSAMTLREAQRRAVLMRSRRRTCNTCSPSINAKPTRAAKVAAGPLQKGVAGS